MSAGMAIRPPAVSGYFYPGDPAILAATVRDLLATPSGSRRRPLALIAPHAGYRYSGLLAARAYRELTDSGWHPQRIVLIGPPHRVPVDGIAAPRCFAFSTPLGDVHVDRLLIDRLAAAGRIELSDRAHADEHCLEVQLPLLQEAIGDFTLVPLLIGNAPRDEVAALLSELADDETLIVASSDLSHFHEDSAARELDHRTLARIEALDGRLAGTDACGCRAVNALLLLAAERGWQPSVLGYCNSADAGGSTEQVVGYGAVAFHGC